ncbi:MAG: MFS transporter [Parachlamydiales bacterium]|nr:MFS transporter [Parachlamydiales bacterium]
MFSDKKNRISLFILILITFIDFMGIGLVYPIFSKILFDPSIPFFSSGTTNEVRGIFLGILFGLMPFAQFFSLSIWGTVSDNKGRKKPLLLSLSFTVLAHFISIFGILFSSISILIVSRFILGIGAGNISIVLASIADISSKEKKAKNFGLYSMAIGAGFTLGPFIGGALSIISFSFPFAFSFVVTLLNLILAVVFFKETLVKFFNKTVSFVSGLKNLKKAFTIKTIRIFFLCSFFTNFGWTYFMDFAPVFLIKKFMFSSADVGIFYGSMGGLFALSSGLLIRPFLSKFKYETLFWISSLIAACSILSIPFYPNFYWLILFVLIFSFFAAFLGPTITTIISNNVSADIQGETLGLFGSVNTAAYSVSALIAGFFVGIAPESSMYVGGGILLISSCIVLVIFNKKLFI